MYFIDGIRGILTDAGVEDDTVQQILDMLDGAQATVRMSEKMPATPAASFGAAPTATELGLHAGKAQSHVIEAMSQMVTGLKGYYDSVDHFRKDVHETDATEATEYSRRGQAAEQVNVTALLNLGASCTQQDNFYDNPTCEPPAEGSDQ